MEAIYQRFRERAEFRVVYIQEAHPTDGWQVESNLRDGIEVAQPTTLAERAVLARECAVRLGLTAPLVLDGLDDAADRAFHAWPERLYVISGDGRIAYQGGKGPYDFKPAELAAFLEGHMPR